MRKLVLLLAAGALWLFLAAVPAFADGGPHVAATNSGVSTLTPDSCAGCHRAHTAQGQYLINQPTEEALCLGCHGTAVAGATTSVMDGVQYALGTDGLRDEGTWLGALRGGGFDTAHIGNVARVDVGTSYKSKVTVASAAMNVTSSHIALSENGLTNPHTLWGNGAVDATANGNAGPSVSLECTDCHNPHGNGQYRILNTVPAPTGATAMSGLPIDMKAIDPVADVIYTKTGHPFQVGDLITIAASDAAINGNWVVWAIPNGISIQIAATSAANLGISAVSAFDIPNGTATLGTIVRTSAPIHDSPVGNPDAAGVYPLKNYTVIQAKGTQATQAGYTFYATNVTSANTTGDYFHRQVPWDAASGSVYDGPNGWNATVAASNQVAYNVQMTAWCSSCHSRYYAYQNPNPGGWDGTSTFLDRTVASFATTTLTIDTTNPAGGSALTSSGFSLGDVVSTSGGITPAVTNGYIVYASGMNIRVSATFAGAPITFTVANGGKVARVAPASASNYFFPDQNSAGQMDTIFKYQHSTRSDRVCSTCHVAHGSNRVMSGTFTYNYTQPDSSQPTKYTVTDPTDGVGTVNTADSRLLKIDNRGTCAACHDPTADNTTGTGWANGFTGSGTYQGANSPTYGSGITGGSWSTNAAGQPINTGGTTVLP